MSHDASATWSGFNYQGKVALYHTLTLIRQKLHENEDFDFPGYLLILESHEDFDIKGPDGFISFHQVKAMNQTAFNKYEDALFAMLLQLDSPDHSSVIGYLHTWKSLNWNGNDRFDQKLRAIIKKVIDDHDADPTSSLIQKTFTNASVAEKKIKILRQAKGEDARLVDEESVYEILNQAHASTGGECIVNRVKQYDYDGVLACGIDAIDVKVKGAISELHNTFNIDSDDNALDKIFCALLAKLDENVILKHSNLNSGDETPISFLEIIGIVTDERIRDSDEAYLASRFKLQFIKAFEEFLDDEELCSPDIAEAYSNGDSNLNVAMDVLLDLSASELLFHFKKLNPHVSLNTENTLDNALLTNIDDLRQYLFAIFRDICCTKFSHKQSAQLILYKNGSKIYLPTTIGTQTKKNIVIKIMNNSHAISSLFEVTAMLTGCEYANEIESFADEYSKLSEVSLKDFYIDELPEEREKISQISRSIRLIKVTTAIEEIKNA